LPEHRLSVEFVDGLQGIVDLHALIRSPQAGVLARLRDRALFRAGSRRVLLAPDAMHAEIQRNGQWVVE